jgi:hypothetical protein
MNLVSRTAPARRSIRAMLIANARSRQPVRGLDAAASSDCLRASGGD